MTAPSSSLGMVRAGLWLVGLVGAGVALRYAALGELATPPLSSTSQLGQWVESRSAATAAMAIVRLFAELATWYLVALSLLHAIASGGGRTSRAVADALSLPGARRVVCAGLGLGLVASSGLGAADADAGGPPQGQGTGRATMVPVTDGTATMTPIAPIAPIAPVAPEVHDVGPPSRWPATWRVVEGESMWSIAEELVADHAGQSPGPAAVDRLWRRLIEANRHRLVDPDDPDLILPGQVFEVPAHTP